jgi:drug/metabolite transporter (DMT)-like permease
MDAASFTLIRLASGAAMLVIVLRLRSTPMRSVVKAGSWLSAATLVGYAILFSLAYRSIPAGVGALVLFAAVQLTMLTSAVRAGTGPRGAAWFGVVLAFGGLAALTLPGATAPDPLGVLMMSLSGIGWGIYSLHGRSVTRPTEATAGNFVFATLLALPLLIFFQPLQANGVLLAIFAGAITSGLGYVLWYTVLPNLGTTRAAVLQLSVPVIASAAGVTMLGEQLTTRLLLSSAAILGGIFVVIWTGPSPKKHE